METIKRRQGTPYFKVTLKWTPLVWVYIRATTSIPQYQNGKLHYFADVDGDIWCGSEYMCYGPASEHEMSEPYYG